MEEGLNGLDLSVLQPVTWASLALLVVTGVGLILLWEQEKKRQLEGWLSCAFFTFCTRFAYILAATNTKSMLQ